MYNKKWICKKCGYETNRKQNYETHIGRQAACEKRLKRLNDETMCQTVYDINHMVNGTHHTVNDINHMVNGTHHTVNDINHMVNDDIYQSNKVNLLCLKCNKKFANKQSLQRHSTICKGYVNPLQCPTCKKLFSCKQSKYLHIKNVKCEFVEIKDEKDILIEELEEGKKKLEEELEEKDKQLEEARSRPTTVYNTTNNYFDHSINYNNYDNLSVDHITKEDIKRLFINCRMQYPELSEDLTRMLLKPKENQCIYLPEGPKSNTCAVIKDGIEMRKPMIRVLMDLGVQTGILIRDSNVIERNKKDVINNQFWADNRNACGLNISDIEYMTENDKEMVQRNKNVVLDMGDGKI